MQVDRAAVAEERLEKAMTEQQEMDLEFAQAISREAFLAEPTDDVQQLLFGLPCWRDT
jgi:hypothetical protein